MACSPAWLTVGLLPLAVAGCASAPPPPSVAAAATELNQPAPQPLTPDAQASMEQARLKLNAAQRAAADGRSNDADALAQEAMLDIRVARARVAAAKAESAARDQQTAIEALRDQTRR